MVIHSCFVRKLVELVLSVCLGKRCCSPELSMEGVEATVNPSANVGSEGEEPLVLPLSAYRYSDT